MHRRTKTDPIERVRKIPQELKDLPQWVCWRSEPAGSRNKKVPICPTTDEHASVSDPATRGSFLEALGGCLDYEVDGIGFVFTSADPYLGIDLDGVIEDGQIADWAQELVDRLGTYAEISPSGTGIHLILRHPDPTLDWNRKPGVEVYAEDRYFTMTGESISWDNPIADAGEAFEKWYAGMRGGSGPVGAAFPAASAVLALEDQEIIEQAMAFEEFPRLYLQGDMGRYGEDHSRADLALLDLLVKAGATTPEQLDRLFRASALCRDKWDREDYRTRTIERALDGTVLPGIDTRTEEERLRDEVRSLRERNRQLQEMLEHNRWMESTAASIQRNGPLGRHRVTAAVLLKRFASMGSRNEPWDFGAITVSSLADDAGICRHTVRRHLEFLRDAGLIAYETVFGGTWVDDETGRKGRGRHARIAPVGSVREFGEKAAMFSGDMGKGGRQAGAGGRHGLPARRPPASKACPDPAVPIPSPTPPPVVS